jgi:anti-sigma factor ChrR (cupin superfamily)
MFLLLLLTDYARKEAESRYESVNRAISVPDGNVGVLLEDVDETHVKKKVQWNLKGYGVGSILIQADREEDIRIPH